MNYDLEIKKHKDEIKKLEALKEEKEKLELPNIVGNCYRIALRTFIKVREVERQYKDDYGDIIVEVEGLVVTLDYDKKQATIKTNDSYRVLLDNLIEESLFNKAIDEACLIIQQSCKAII